MSLTDVRASARPTKAFFVRMLTRDISLLDCILDLIDNSVDAAWSNSGMSLPDLEESDRLREYHVDITIETTQFSITDTCGGIALDDAVNYAFTFGSDRLLQREGHTIGVYGIGMKRAVFKLGDRVQVRSTTEADEPFAVHVNVPAWLQDESDVWDFDLDESEPLSTTGVEIRVTELTDDTALAFSNPSFRHRLRRTIARDYMLALMHGLSISVNGEAIKRESVTVKHGIDYQPMRKRYTDGEVTVDLIAGMYESPPDQGEPSDRSSPNRYGWYVVCNGRVIVAADKSGATVWGREGFPRWHPQYDGFVGFVFFTSHRPQLLPMTTTKRSIDAGSPLYKRALATMRDPTRDWIDYTNQRKNELEKAKAKEAKTTPVTLATVEQQPKMRFPKIGITTKKAVANVNYSVTKERMLRLAAEFGRISMPYREVGKRSFDYAYSQLVDDEDT